jgi:Flp pilus assembly pilin Flp
MKNQKGASTFEYVLLLSCITLGVSAVLFPLSSTLNQSFASVRWNSEPSYGLISVSGMPNATHGWNPNLADGGGTDTTVTGDNP